MLKENLVALVETAIRENWDRPALTDYGQRTVTFSQVGRRIKFFHLLFKKCQVKRGDHIAVCGPNSVNWAEAYLAVVTYGATVVPILTDFQTEDIHHIVNHSESRFFFLTDAIYSRLDEEMMPALEGLFSLDNERFVINGSRSVVSAVEWAEEESRSPRQALTREEFRLPGDIPNDAIAALVYTSGTTGFSKGVMLPYNSLVANILFGDANITLPQPAPIISFLPMAHAYSCSFEFLFPFTVGAHITFLGVIPSPKILLEAFAEVRPCLVISVPLVMEKIFKKRIAPVINTAKVKLLLKTPGISSLLRRKIKKALREAFGGKYEVIVIGGAALNPEIEEFFRKIKLRFTVGYGMTECGPLISYAPWDEHRPGSVGKVVTNLEIKIDSPSPATQAGEIMVKGEHVMAGYYKNPTATDEVLGEDGWLRTGDLGIIDKDGFIFIRGRSKNMILGPSGQNIYPEEIENKINSMEFVQESLVIESEGRPIALIYPDWEAIDSLKPKQQDREGWLNKVMENIKKEVNRQLPRYAAISRVKVQPEPFEKTPTQKIKRYLYKI